MNSLEQPYNTLHAWVRRNFGRAVICEFNLNHFSARYHWSNKSGEYSKDRDDWQQLCPKCHKEYDKRTRPLRDACRKGHGYSEDNIIWRNRGDSIWRQCRKCHNMNTAAYRKRIKELT